MPRKKKKSLPVIPLPPLAAFWKKEKKERRLTYGMIEEKTGIPDSTLSRWFNGEVADLKASQIANVSVAMGIPWWKSMARALLANDEPADPTEEAQRIAFIIADEEELQSIMGDAIRLSPNDRRALRKVAQSLKQGD